jgi:peptidoglycan-associated lipoprotein
MRRVSNKGGFKQLPYLIKKERFMGKVRLVILVFVVALIGGALSGCSCFQQKMRGETAPPAPSAITQVPSSSAPGNPREAKQEIVVPVQKNGTAGQGPAMGVVLKDIYYDFDKYNIRPQDADILKRDFVWFRDNQGSRVQIEGNCDERGTVEYNLVLGQKRTDSAKSYLVDLGVDSKLLDTISYGKERPADPAHNEAAWAKNRRSHFAPLK